MKLYIPSKDQSFGLSAYSALLKSFGVEVVSAAHGADAVLPLTDLGSLLCVDHPRFMPSDSLQVVLTRHRLHETGLPALPTTPIQNADEAPSGTLVKTANSAVGGYVFQPHLGFPQEDLDVTFSVNQAGELMEVCVLHLTHEAAKKPTTLREVEQGEKLAIMQALSLACDRLLIKGGIHNVQFLRYEGQWCVIDWNPRPAFAHSEGMASMHPYMARPLAHMLGLPLPEFQPPHFKNESFWDKPIPLFLEAKIRQIGLLPRRHGISRGFPRVSGVASTQEKLADMFNQLKTLL